MEPTKFSPSEILTFACRYLPENETQLVVGSCPTTLDKMTFRLYYPNPNNNLRKIEIRREFLARPFRDVSEKLISANDSKSLTAA